MDFSQIKRLVKLVETSNISELEVNEEGSQIRISKAGSSPASQPVMVSQSIPAAPPPQTAEPAQVPTPKAESAEKVAEGLIEICSPMVGTFYRSPSPDAAVYVNEGDTIQPGKVLCIVEAMKLMNEIEAEISGTITKILVENSQPVEYNQPLFLVKKS
jgi:acetyl-CoA carboxylase biotin carboxyl carrier protein